MWMELITSAKSNIKFPSTSVGIIPHKVTRKKITREFILIHRDIIPWQLISKTEELSEDLIREFQDEVDWRAISCYQQLSEDFIREFQDKIQWIWVSANQNLSENLIREFKDRVDWRAISTYQKLSENFIREFKTRVDWDAISIYQKLSNNFIDEFKDNISKKRMVLNSKNLSIETYPTMVYAIPNSIIFGDLFLSKLKEGFTISWNDLIETLSHDGVLILYETAGNSIS